MKVHIQLETQFELLKICQV